jgi:acetolactate synthase I/III small subunit
MLRILSLMVENNPGVLAHISGMFSGKGYNLDSLTVGPTIDKSVSRMTISCITSDSEFEQIKKQLNRLIDVIKVVELTKKPAVTKELMIIKLSTKKDTRAEVFQLTQVYDCLVIDVTYDKLILQVCENTENINKILKIVAPYGIVEMARSGIVSMLEH